MLPAIWGMTEALQQLRAIPHEMFPLILTVLNGDSSAPYYDPHEGLLVQGGNIPNYKLLKPWSKG